MRSFKKLLHIPLLPGNMPLPPGIPGIRLSRAALAACATAHYNIERFKEHAHMMLPNLLESETKKTNESNLDVALTRKHIKLLIEQAFKDNGVKSNVYTQICLPSDDSLPNAGVSILIDEKGEKSAFVEITKLPKVISDNTAFYRMIYAIASHEAIHFKHNHHFSNSLVHAIVAAYPSLIMFTSVLHSIVSRLFEIDADLTASWKIGSAKDLIKHMEQSIAEAKKLDECSHSNDQPLTLRAIIKGVFLYLLLADVNSHPALTNRKFYLKCADNIITLFKKEDKFLTNSVIQAILEEREAFEKAPNKELALTSKDMPTSSL